MNYYRRHIGDYIKDAGHLTLLEHGVYARLMDVYYSREEGIPEDKAARLIGARTKDELQTLKNVLDEFFTLADGTWTQKRCEVEIKAASQKGDANRENGKKGGRPKRTQTEPEPTKNPVGFDSDSEKNLSHKPLANNQNNPPKPPGGGQPIGQDESQKRKAAIALQTYLDDCRKTGAKAIPEGHAVFSYAAKVGIPDDFLRLHWLEFRERYTMPEAKRYKSWATVFHKSVKGNWFRIWHCGGDGGNYALTTVGLQAQRNHAEVA